jgi:uncharacterized protein (TIRG00374 family)
VAARVRTRGRRKLILSLLLAAAIFGFLATRVDVAGVWATIAAMTWLELASIALAAAWNSLTYWALWVAVTPGLSLGRAAVLALSGTAVTNAIPGGSGIGVGLTYAMLGSWGFPRSRSSVAVLVSGIWNSFIKLGMPVLALGLLALSGAADSGRIVAAVGAFALLGAAVAVLALMLRSERLAARFGSLAGRLAARAARLAGRHGVGIGWDHATVKFRVRVLELLRRRLPAITLVALVSHLSLYLVLLVSLRHVGVGDEVVSWVQVLAVFTTARLVTMVRFTPGGAGVVEAVLIGGLVAAGGPAAQVTAAVLVFRAITWLLPVPFGALAYVGWRLAQARRSKGAGTLEGAGGRQ